MHCWLKKAGWVVDMRDTFLCVFVYGLVSDKFTTKTSFLIFYL